MKSSRKEAIAAVEPWYNTKKPCKYGHYAKRATVDGSCTACRIQHNKEERASIRRSLQSR